MGTEQSGDLARIAAAVEDCIAGAQKSEQPYRHVNDFLLLLRRAKWTEPEILAVQSGVLQAFKKRRETGQASGSR